MTALKPIDMFAKAIKEGAKRTIIYDALMRFREVRAVHDWERRGRPVPPPHYVKQRIVKEYGRRFSIGTLVESGTYLGDMVDATKDSFGRIISIELDRALFQKARERFLRYEHISIVQGDSAVVLPDVLAGIAEPCLFWLDGHYSGENTAKGVQETPVTKELDCILRHPIHHHVILIDDARLFVGRNGYPTLPALCDLVRNHRSDWVVAVEEDIARIHEKDRTENTTGLEPSLDR